jgi:hypothetical protein
VLGLLSLFAWPHELVLGRDGLEFGRIRRRSVAYAQILGTRTVGDAAVLELDGQRVLIPGQFALDARALAVTIEVRRRLAAGALEPPLVLAAQATARLLLACA